MKERQRMMKGKVNVRGPVASRLVYMREAVSAHETAIETRIETEIGEGNGVETETEAGTGAGKENGAGAGTETEIEIESTGTGIARATGTGTGAETEIATGIEIGGTERLARRRVLGFAEGGTNAVATRPTGRCQVCESINKSGRIRVTMPCEEGQFHRTKTNSRYDSGRISVGVVAQSTAEIVARASMIAASIGKRVPWFVSEKERTATEPKEVRAG